MSLLHSFRHAGRGIQLVYRGERNFRIELWVGLAVLMLAMVLRVEVWEFVLLFLLTMSVLLLELLNSVFERVVDILKPRLHHYAGDAKDMLAAMVLIMSGGAAILGALILLPYAFALIN